MTCAITALAVGLRSAALARSDALLEEFGLAAIATRRAASLSGGMRRRLELVQALVHRPAILFLDEPTTGLDPTARTQLWNHLAEIRHQGTTIFLTTQYLEEVDHLCDRVAIVNHGRLVASDTPRQLKALVGDEGVTVEVEGGEAEMRQAYWALSAVADSAPTTHNRSVTITMKDAGRRLSEVVRVLDEAEVNITTLLLTGPSLDDVFLHFTDQRAQPLARAPLRAQDGMR